MNPRRHSAICTVLLAGGDLLPRLPVCKGGRVGDINFGLNRMRSAAHQPVLLGISRYITIAARVRQISLIGTRWIDVVAVNHGADRPVPSISNLYHGGYRDCAAAAVSTVPRLRSVQGVEA